MIRDLNFPISTGGAFLVEEICLIKGTFLGEIFLKFKNTMHIEISITFEIR
jgi:hypothetical protein